jgi:dTDP-4-dehydrorhamnose reductase
VKILVIGRFGQLACALAQRASLRPDIALRTAARPDADLERPGSVAAAIGASNADLVVNCAAYTDVDRAEREEERAYRINAGGAGEVALAAAALGVPVIHLSTDYVFDGRFGSMYREDGETNPLGAYGRSKAAGEEEVRRANPRHAIVRTSWLFSPYRKNFLKTVLGLGRAAGSVSIVSDQRGCPSSALDVADGLLALVDRWKADPGRGIGETYHLAGTGDATWFDFASVIAEEAARLGLARFDVKPIPSRDRPAPAVRPVDSRLDSSKFASAFGFRMPAWQTSVRKVLEILSRDKEAAAGTGGDRPRKDP